MKTNNPTRHSTSRNDRGRFRSSLEHLESRLLLTITHNGCAGGTLEVSADADGDNVLVSSQAVNIVGEAITVNGAVVNKPNGEPCIVGRDVTAARVQGDGDNDANQFQSRLDQRFEVTLDGGGGDDLLEALPPAVGNPADTEMSGGEGNDTLRANTGSDTLRGGPGSDDLNGGGGNDVLFGSAGADTLRGGAGNDRLDGGADDDQLLGEDDSDTLKGGPGNDLLNGGTSDDRLEGSSGNDTLGGGAGDPLLTNNDTLLGGSGNDLIEAGAGSDSVHAGSGDDFVNGATGNDTLKGGGGKDTINGNAGDDIIKGGPDTDVLEGGAGNDDTFGNTGNDRFIFTDGSGSDRVFESPRQGNDTMDFAAVTSRLVFRVGNHLKISTIGTQAVHRGNKVENLIGGEESDLFRFETNGVGLAGGIGTIQDNGGINKISYAKRSDPISVNLAAKQATGLSSISGFRRVDGGSGNDRLVGSKLNDTLRGLAGEDRIVGGKSSDRLDGGNGNDIISDGPGTDVLLGGNGNDRLTDHQSLPNLPNLLVGGRGCDTVNGAFANDPDCVIPKSDVVAVNNAGVLEITGNNRSNAVVIEPVNEDTFRITGRSGTLVNGQSEVEISGVSNGVIAEMNGGSDSVEFSGATDQDITVRTDGGNDIVQFQNADIGGTTTMETGDGGDLVAIIDSLLTDSGFETGNGNDRLDLDASRIRGVLSVSLGGGRDSLQIEDSRFDQLVNVLAGSGNDRVDIERSGDSAGLESDFASAVELILGAGNDRVRIGIGGQAGNSANLGGTGESIEINGGVGVDTVDAGLLSDPNANGNSIAGESRLISIEEQLS